MDAATARTFPNDPGSDPVTTRRKTAKRHSLISVKIQLNRRRRRRRLLKFLTALVKNVRQAGQEARATRGGQRGVPLGKSMRGGSKGGGSPWTPPDDPWAGDRRGVLLEPPDEEQEPEQLDAEQDEQTDDNADPSGVAGGAV